MIFSAQAVNIAHTVKRASAGALHVVIAGTKKEAYYLASDLDNFLLEENLFYFPASAEKSEYKKLSKVCNFTKPKNIDWEMQKCEQAV